MFVSVWASDWEGGTGRVHYTIKKEADCFSILAHPVDINLKRSNILMIFDQNNQSLWAQISRKSSYTMCIKLRLYSPAKLPYAGKKGYRQERLTNQLTKPPKLRFRDLDAQSIQEGWEKPKETLTKSNPHSSPALPFPTSHTEWDRRDATAGCR